MREAIDSSDYEERRTRNHAELRCSANEAYDLVRNFLDCPISGLSCHPVSKRWAEIDDLLLCDVVPNREQLLIASNVLEEDPVKLVVGPTLFQIIPRENHDRKPTSRNTSIDLSALAITDLQRDWRKPHV